MIKLAHACLFSMLTGCASYQWQKAEDVDRTIMSKIETPLAIQFCSGLLGSQKRGCAVRLVNLGRCVVVILPGDGEAAAHETGHCLGYRHD